MKSIQISLVTKKITIDMKSFSWSGGTVIINNDNFLGFLDASTNIATKWATTINPAVQTWIPPTPADGYFVVSVWWNLNQGTIWFAGQWQLVLFSVERKTSNDANAVIQAHINDFNNPHETSFWNLEGNARDNADLDSELTALDDDITAISNTLPLKADLVSWKVPASQLPSFVDDVEEYADLASFPVTWETWKIYLALDTNLTYRWSWSVYVQLSEAERWSITGTLSNQTDLQNALNSKADNASNQTTSTTVTLTKDTRHGTSASPITWDITVDLTGAIDGPVAKIHHAQGTIPTFTNATVYSGEYDTTVQNFIQIERDGTTANVYISQANA